MAPTLLGLALLIQPVDARTGDAAPDPARGALLFGGDAPLHGRLYTQSEDLPDNVVRCANCHAYGTSPAVARSIAPRLSAGTLRAPRRRRGGPASSYDDASFCRVVRLGIDPTQILINVEMPRYALSDDDCAALWTFLTSAP